MLTQLELLCAGGHSCWDRFFQAQSWTTSPFNLYLAKGRNTDAGMVLDRTKSDETKSQLRSHTEKAQGLDIFGSPSFITADGELFWGNDRLDAALDWAKR